MINIREASKEDKNRIILFIKNHWNANHIFVKDEFFFEYLYAKNNKVNFIVGEIDQDIVAVLGYIPYADLERLEMNDIFLALWKSCDNTMAGIKCLEYLINSGCKSISCCGINEKVERIYKFLGFNTGKLNHWYMLNINIGEYKIASVKNKIEPLQLYIGKDNEVYLEDVVTEQEFNEIQQEYFLKSYQYFKHKYLDHPYYTYKIYSIRGKNKIKLLVVTREIDQSNAKCLRIIDLIGEPIYLKEMNFYKMLLENQYEYIDFYEIGIKKSILEDIGFILRIDQDENIIPNYFEPFEQKNIDIYYMTNWKGTFCMFKGDGDQDRPSIVREQYNEK